MSKKYEDYDYEVEENNSQTLIKKALIILLVIIAVIIIVYLIRGCSKKETDIEETPIVQTDDYENQLLIAAKKYLDADTEKYPAVIGECTKITLTELKEKNLIDTVKFATCNGTTTYVNVCKLTNGNLQYTPWLTCQDKNSESEYGELKEGKITDVIANKTYVEFKFMPQYLKSTNYVLGSVEELWKSDIKYSSYKTLGTTTYYRYRDKLSTWNISVNNYFSTTGNSNNANDIKEYYVTSPNNEYTLKDNETTAYRWFKKAYATNPSNGGKLYDYKAIDGYPIQGEAGETYTQYWNPTSGSQTYAPTLYHICASNAQGTGALVYTPYKCNERKVSQSIMEQYKYDVGTIYSCTQNPLLTEDEQARVKIVANKVSGATSICYASWSKISGTCNPNNDNCKATSLTYYSWYKKDYYTNKAASDVYYVSAPASGYERDDSTKATAYNWYKQTTLTTSEYTVDAPSGYSNATRTNDYKWTNWSDWSTKKENKNGREFELKVKVKLQKMTSNGDETWENLSDNYVDLSTMLAIFTSKNYVANSLSDVDVNGEIRYQIKMYVRNKKEVIK